MSSSPLIVLDKLGVTRRGRVILQEVSLSLAPGDIVTVIGPNGAGKSTLLQVILGLQSYQSGKLHKQKGLRIGYMPQHMPLNPSLPMTVADFLHLLVASYDAIKKALEAVSASHCLSQSMLDLSGGELQRVLLARALLRQPELLVLDEPVQGVDVTGQVALYDLISKIRDDYGCGVLLVSHDLHLVMSNTDHVICLNGHVCCEGHPEHIKQDPKFVEAFGSKAGDVLALYAHHHNHQHDVTGCIVSDHKHEESDDA